MEPFRIVDAKVHARLAHRMPAVVDGPVEQHIVVRLTGLHERLHATDIAIERGKVVPEGVARIELVRRVELPPGPRHGRRRVRRAVIDQMIDPREEHAVGGLLDLVQRRREVLAEPRERLGRRERTSSDVCRRGRELVDERIAVRSAEHAEDLRLGNVGGGVEVEEVAGRPVRLLTHERAVCVRPARELLDEILAQHVAECLAIVRLHARDMIGLAATGERRQLGGEIVAAMRAEVVEQADRGVARVLERIVEVGANGAAWKGGHALFEHREVVRRRDGGERVDGGTFATRRRALHIVAGEARLGDVDRPRARRRVPGGDAGGFCYRYLDALAVG